MLRAADAHGFERQLRADEVDEVAAHRRRIADVGDVDGDQIHGHAPDDRRQLAANGDGAAGFRVRRTGVAEDAVGIAGSDGGDAARGWRAIGCRVADVRAGRHVLHLQNARRDAHHRLHRRALLGRLAAIQRVAGAHEIEVELLAKHQPVGSGEAGARLRQPRAQAIEGDKLLAVHGVARVIGAGEVADEHGDVEPADQLLVADEGGEVGFAHAKAIETGVDMQRRRRRARAARRQGSPRARLLEAGHDRAHAQRRNLAGASGHDAVEHVDGGAGGEGDGALRFHLRGDEEVAATRLVQRGNDALGAETVGIGFDDGRAPGGRDAFGERAPVGTDLREVDLDDAGGAGRDLRGLDPLDDVPRRAAWRRLNRQSRIPVRHQSSPGSRMSVVSSPESRRKRGVEWPAQWVSSTGSSRGPSSIGRL